MRIAYVVLHYLAGTETMECVRSILKSAEGSLHQTCVIVVDNGSPNDSFTMLQDSFSGEDRVVLLQSRENLGFARGNNLGFHYAKHEWKADFIVMLNNDTLVEQQDFNDVLVRKFEETHYAVLGPDIVTADGFHQNPGSKQSWSDGELLVYRMKKRVRILISYLNLDKAVSGAVKAAKEVYRRDALPGDLENTILHGACLIFSPVFIERFEGLCDRTFLYWEEDILKLQADCWGFLMLYSSELRVYHKEDVATNMTAGSSGQKSRRYYKNLIASSKVYSQLKRELGSHPE